MPQGLKRLNSKKRSKSRLGKKNRSTKADLLPPLKLTPQGVPECFKWRYKSSLYRGHYTARHLYYSENIETYSAPL